MIRTKGGTYFRKIELFDLPENKSNHISDKTAQAVLASGKPELSVDELTQCRFGFPVFRNGEIISIAVCETKSMNEIGGVIELWQPVGRYDEVRLTDFKMSVASFVSKKDPGCPDKFGPPDDP
jgi:hypothetical protein